MNVFLKPFIGDLNAFENDFKGRKKGPNDFLNPNQQTQNRYFYIYNLKEVLKIREELNWIPFFFTTFHLGLRSQTYDGINSFLTNEEKF